MKLKLDATNIAIGAAVGFVIAFVMKKCNTGCATTSAPVIIDTTSTDTGVDDTSASDDNASIDDSSIDVSSVDDSSIDDTSSALDDISSDTGIDVTANLAHI